MFVSKKNTTNFTLDVKCPPTLTPAQKKRLGAMKVGDIDYSDIPPLDAKFWSNLDIAMSKGGKQATGIRLDAEVLDWFKKNGRGYQSHINAVLRAYVFTHKGL
jgi:uncharacterized protein (DUF4415 family)